MRSRATPRACTDNRMGTPACWRNSFACYDACRLPVVEDRRCEHGARVAEQDAIAEVLERSRTTRGNTAGTLTL